MIARLIIRRMFFLILVLFGLSLITFALSHMVPADPARMIAGPRASKSAVEKIREDYGLNDPLPVQYIDYVKGVIQLDFGTSFSSRRPVSGSSSLIASVDLSDTPRRTCSQRIDRSRSSSWVTLSSWRFITARASS